MAKHMLLVGLSRQVHKRAHDLGLRLSVIMPTPQVKRAVPSLYTRLVGLPDAAGVEAWVEAARLIHQWEPVEAIGGFNELTQDHAAAIASALGLPFHTPEVIRFTRRKDEMRRVLRAAGLDTTPSQVVASRAEIEAFGATHGYPVVLKPVDGRGSLAVAILHSSEDVAPAVTRFQRHAGDASMLVEGYLRGEEYSVEGFSEGGRHRIIAITQKFKDPVTCVETGHCLPAPLCVADCEAIGAFVARALTAIGLERGPTHTEVFLTPAGPQIVETHARWGGDNIVDLLRLVTGIDADGLWIRQFAGESVFDEVPAFTKGFASVSFASPPAVGRLVEVRGATEASALPGVDAVEVLQSIGAPLGVPSDSSERGASAIAVGDTAEEATTRARDAAGALRFVVSCPA